jgi:hypothetical protein
MHMKKSQRRLKVFLCMFMLGAVIPVPAAFGAGNPACFFLSPLNQSATIDFYNYYGGIQFFIITAFNAPTAIDSLTISLKANPKMKNYEGELTYMLLGLGGAELFFFGIETVSYSTTYSNSIEKTLSVNAAMGFAIAGVSIVHLQGVDGEVPFTIRVSFDAPDA